MRLPDRIRLELDQFISGQHAIQNYELTEEILAECLKRIYTEKVKKEISGAFDGYTVGDLEKAIELLAKPKPAKSSGIPK